MLSNRLPLEQLLELLQLHSFLLKLECHSSVLALQIAAYQQKIQQIHCVPLKERA